MSLRKIVVGIDEATGARDAAALGHALAEASGAGLLLVAAYQDPLLPFPPTFGNDHRVQEARERLAAVRPTWAPDAQTELVADVSAARALRRAAREQHADLIVVGSTAKAPRGCARAGRTGRQVLHAARCPVAIAAAGVHEDAGPLRRIVVGVDETPESHAALTFAHALARSSAATVTALAVAEEALPVSPTPWATLVEVARWDEIVATRRRILDARLDALVEELPGTVRELRVGDPAEELAAAGAEADLLVVGSRRWGALERIALGSTSEELTAGAPCSLVVMPRPKTALNAT